MASKALQYSAETPLKNKMNDSILNSEEITDDEAMEDVIPCSSAKKKAVSRKKLFGSQDEEYDKKYSDSEDDDLSDMTSCKDDEENAEAKNKRKASTSSDDDEDNMVPRQSWLIKLWIQNHNREEWPDLTICQPEDAPHVLKEECRPRREDIEKMCQKGFDSTYELPPP